jgi:hypothetical protein
MIGSEIADTLNCACKRWKSSEFGMAQDEVLSSGGVVADCTYCTLPFSFRVNLRLHAHQKSSLHACSASLRQLLVVLVLSVVKLICKVWGRGEERGRT